MPRAFLVKKPCVSTCKRNWSELPDEERGEIYVPGEATRARAPGGRGARSSGRRRAAARGDAGSRRGRTPALKGRGWGKGARNRGPGIACPRRAAGDAAGCVTARRPPALES